jgi:YD repeat-containing protein
LGCCCIWSRNWANFFINFDQKNDASGAYAYVYDTRDRLRTNSTPQGTLFYGYDANGNVTNITASTASGTSVAYQYDALNRLTNAVDMRLTGTQNTAYGFDVVGNLQRMQYPNNVTNLCKRQA